MFKFAKKISILALVLIISLPFLYAQESKQPIGKPAIEKEKRAEKSPVSASPLPKKNDTNPFLQFINKKAYAARINEDEERKILREKWKELLQIDVFYPYFKAKEVQEWISDRAKIEIFDLKGRPKFENNQIKYIFKKKF